MKRILLFVMTNLAVMVVLGIVINLFGLNRFFWVWLAAYPPILWLQTHILL